MVALLVAVVTGDSWLMAGWGVVAAGMVLVMIWLRGQAGERVPIGA